MVWAGTINLVVYIWSRDGLKPGAWMRSLRERVQRNKSGPRTKLQKHQVRGWVEKKPEEKRTTRQNKQEGVVNCIAAAR